MKYLTFLASLFVLVMSADLAAQQHDRSGIILDVEYHYPKGDKPNGERPKGQVTVQTMQRFLEILRPLKRGVWSPKSDVWFHKSKHFEIAIPTPYFARQAAELKDTPFDKEKRTRGVLEQIAENGTLDGAKHTGDSDLDCILDRRKHVVVFDKSRHVGFVAVKIDYTQTEEGGYLDPKTGIPLTAVGLDTQITITHGSKQLHREKLQCKWDREIGYKYTPADKAKTATAHRLLELLDELLPTPR